MYEARIGNQLTLLFLFLFIRSDRVSHTDDYVFDDGDESTGKDKFEREPFIVRFKGFHTCKMSIFATFMACKF